MPDKQAASNASRYYVLIPAAGVGQRMGVPIPKQYLQLAGKPVLQHVIEVFSACPEIEHVYVVLSLTDAWIDEYIVSKKINSRTNKVTFLRCGGETRRDSVLNGLEAISSRLSLKDWILVHDAARPGLTPELVKYLVDEVGDHPVGGILALPVVDTVKRIDKSRVETISREGLWLAQTPQMFRYGALVQAIQQNPDVTDDAGAIEAMGFMPKLVEGHLSNSKITRPADMSLVEMFLKARAARKRARKNRTDKKQGKS
ncbi:2-C-methyl-D-erythritol 4-phosphate cytidylyltransferase [Oxalobacter vibrioformis]|uniref:2-C-methyl-D-erythritol 4-phosphate cytidylyltransferase n=1 Tax=Oxalobacter vibrioformis TaxID=933080 RepID=A0A9E9LZ37_9BURK|nr:2-C-methyl-D-erythritol 4-phosphate cytidylyltransferase [Oxalobacter vibrioformis]WAW10315.1 2-C-methyl-D-erythritol 4-phosphate cytidylyltransferase [Oxalobacter vibrioformis]